MQELSQETGIVLQARLCSNALPDRAWHREQALGLVFFPGKLLKRRNPGKRLCFLRKTKPEEKGMKLEKRGGN